MSQRLSISDVVSAASAAIAERARVLSDHVAIHGEPTRGASGRLHAPHDGYEWHDGQRYAAGEFLPDDGGTASIIETRYLCASDAAAALIVALDAIGVSASAGSEFDGLRYVYIRSYAHIVRHLPKQDREVVRADAGLRTGKTWRDGRVRYGYHTAEIAA